MRVIKKDQLFGTSICICLLLLFCGAFYNLYITIFGGALYFLPLVICAYYSIKSGCVGRNFRIDKALLWYILWFVPYAISSQFFGELTYYHVIFGTKVSVGVYTATQNLLLLIVGFYFRNKDKSDNSFIKILKIGFIVNTFFTLRAIAIDPNISKVMATASAQQHNVMRVSLFGVVGYSYVYAVLFLIPIFLAAMKTVHERRRIKYGLSIALIIVFIYFSSYFTAFVISIGMIVVYLFLDSRWYVKLLLVPVIMYFFMFIFQPEFVTEHLETLAGVINVENISVRIEQLAEFLKTGEKGDTLSRLDLYQKSIDAFMKYPIAGARFENSDIELSGHADLLDIAGGGGLLSILPYLMFVWNLFQSNMRISNNRHIKNAIITTFVMYITLACINTASTATALMLILTGGIPIIIRNIDVQKGIE